MPPLSVSAPGGYGRDVATGRVTIVSDTHLSPDAPEANDNWDAVVRYVDVVAPDLVIHVGDLSLDGAHDADDLHHARWQLDRLSVAWHAVPGNHDVGDNPWPGSPDNSTMDTDRHRRWLDIVGADHWSLELNGWMLLAINAQLFGSGLEAEAAQWAWLEQRLGEGGSEQPTALITHKPIAATDVELADAPPYRFVPPPVRRRLTDMLAGRHLALVVSGHVHQYRVIDLAATRHLWAPTTWAVLPEDVQPTLGVKRCGVVSVELGTDRRVEPRLVASEDLTQLTLFRDVPNPYQH